ncbi:MFS transporter [Galactobacter valiniphilus]|uniref:MFS transporter n=1 Tax=Galactobacter valiniphilus TaxID=2676122 RepID=UPI003736F953
MTITARSGTDLKFNLYIAAFSAVLYSVLLVAPIVTSQLMVQFSLDASSAGLLASVELGCFSLATLPAYFWLRRANIRTVTILCGSLVIAGNVLSALMPTYGLLLLMRGLTALAAGSITVIILSLSAKTSKPSRSYGIFIVAQLGMGAIILFLFPAIYAGKPVAAVYFTLAALGLLCLPAAWCVKGHELSAAANPVEAVAAGARRVLPFAAALIAVFGFYVALGGVWTFMAKIAETGGTSLGTASTTIGVATLFGVASSLVGTLVGEGSRAKYYVLGGYAAMAASMFLLFGAPGLVRFALSAILFKIAWSWLLPFLLAAVSRVGGAQVMNSTNLMIGSGLAAGPILAGAIIDATGGFSTMLIVSIAILAVSVSCSVVVMRAPAAAAAPAAEPELAGAR